MFRIAASYLREKKMKLLQLIKTVLWGFFGVRKRAGLEVDAKADPSHIILAGIVAAVAFIGVLIAAVKTALRVLA
jgi:hypothetical protein